MTFESFDNHRLRFSVLWNPSCCADSGSGSDDTPLHKATAPPGEASHAHSRTQPPNAPSLQRRSLPPQRCSPLGTSLQHSFIGNCWKKGSRAQFYCACVCGVGAISRYNMLVLNSSRSLCLVITWLMRLDVWVCASRGVRGRWQLSIGMYMEIAVSTQAAHDNCFIYSPHFDMLVIVPQ